MIHLSYNGELYSYDNKTTTTVSAVTNIPVVIHPYVDIEGAKLYYKQDDVDGIVDISDNIANIPGAYLVTGDLQVALKLASSEMSNYFTIGVTVISSSGDIMDDDIRFTMDNKKRLILVPGYQTLLAIQFDNQSEIVTFKLPRYQEGIDLSTKVPYVNYRRPQVKDLGKSLCTIEKITEDSIYITWMVDATATQYDGVIQFQVEFADSEGYRWQSQIGEIPILASLYNTGLEPYTPDILEQYLGMMQEYAQQAAASAQEAREIEQSMEGKGLTEDFKQALLQVVAHIGAWSDAYGQDYYDALYEALYPPINLRSISALFQPGTEVINDTMSLNDLKQYLTVTAVYTDDSTEELSSSDYSLSGSMAEGNQTITVSYGGKTTTFNVTVVSWVSSISAVFTQGSATIYEMDSLDTLRQYLVVTANYSDSTTATVTDYTLSGTLAEGTSTITVSYGGKTDTFNVTVTNGIRIPNGDFTFSDGTTINITNNHASIILGSANAARYINLSHLSNNISDITDMSGINNQSTNWLQLSAGDNIQLDVTNANSSNTSWSSISSNTYYIALNIRKINTANSILPTEQLYPAQSTPNHSRVTSISTNATMTEDTVASNMFIYIPAKYPSGTQITFDISLTVE